MATAKKAKSPAAAAAPKKSPAKAPAAKVAKSAAPQAKGGGKKTCTIEGCKRGYRAKGYCFFHYKKWRRAELPHSRYDSCSNAECHKPATKHGLCETHLAARAGKAAAPAAAAAPAPAAAPAA